LLKDTENVREICGVTFGSENNLGNSKNKGDREWY